MLHDLDRGRPPALRPDAVVVVGSGAAGTALALRLAERGQAVVLLESGPDPRTARPGGLALADDHNAGDVEGLPFRLQTGRARRFGGTTALWYGQCMRLQALDLEPRPWVPHSGWPLTLPDLEPGYAAAEALPRRPDRRRVVRDLRARLRRSPWDPDRLLLDDATASPDAAAPRDAAPHRLERSATSPAARAGDAGAARGDRRAGASRSPPRRRPAASRPSGSCWRPGRSRTPGCCSSATRTASAWGTAGPRPAATCRTTPWW